MKIAGFELKYAYAVDTTDLAGSLVVGSPAVQNLFRPRLIVLPHLVRDTTNEGVRSVKYVWEDKGPYSPLPLTDRYCAFVLDVVHLLAVAEDSPETFFNEMRSLGRHHFGHDVDWSRL